MSLSTPTASLTSNHSAQEQPDFSLVQGGDFCFRSWCVRDLPPNQRIEAPIAGGQMDMSDG